MRFSALVTSLCLLCCVPQEGLCLSQSAQDEFLRHVIMNDDWLEQVDLCAEMIKKAEDPKAESRQFLHSLIQAVNIRYGGTMTVAESCRQVRKKIDIFPKKIRNRLKNALSELAQPVSTRVAYSNGPFNNWWAIVIMFAILCVVVFLIAILQPGIAATIIPALTLAAAEFVKGRL